MFSYSKKLSLAISMFAAVIILQGCGTTQVKMSNQDRANLNKLGTIKIIHQDTGWPTLKTPLGVLASDLTAGLSEDWSAGQKLMVKFKVPDPAALTQNKFYKQISKQRVASFKTVEKGHPYDESDIETLQRRYSGTVLKISPVMMQIWYFPFNWSRYHMWFSQKAELINLADGKILWSSICRSDQNNKETAPTLDELTADNSTVLKTWVNNATSQCTQQLVDDFMGNSKA